MRYVLQNNIWPPPLNTWIATSFGNETIICLVNKHLNNDNVLLIMMNKQGKIMLNKNQSWFFINADNTPSLRHNFEIYDNSNINQYVKNHYDMFAQKYINT